MIVMVNGGRSERAGGTADTVQRDRLALGKCRHELLQIGIFRQAGRQLAKLFGSSCYFSLWQVRSKPSLSSVAEVVRLRFSPPHPEVSRLLLLGDSIGSPSRFLNQMPQPHNKAAEIK